METGELEKRIVRLKKRLHELKASAGGSTPGKARAERKRLKRAQRKRRSLPPASPPAPAQPSGG